MLANANVVHVENERVRASADPLSATPEIRRDDSDEPNHGALKRTDLIRSLIGLIGTLVGGWSIFYEAWTTLLAAFIHVSSELAFIMNSARLLPGVRQRVS